tara:strand:- start:3693 stop:4307 length:615 start_codon:yes stop_codon:yes gene_type:complete
MEQQPIATNSLSDLAKKMKTTSYARYDAHKRCERLNNASLFALTSVSMLLISFSILGAFSPEHRPLFCNNHLELFSLLTSIIMLIISLVVSFASYSLKSERYFRAGNEIGELCDRLSFIDMTNSNAVNAIAEQYYSIRKNSDNHQGYNYKRGRLDRKLQDDASIEEKDELKIFDYFGYWAPIISFYIISISSVIFFLYAIVKFI